MMKLSAPKKTTWWIALVVGLLGILLKLGILAIADASAYSFWLVMIAYLLLLLATAVKGV